jgi:carbon storage regulator
MERILIGDSVVVTVLEIHGNKARIGISAPKDILVLRSELQEGIPERPPDLAEDIRGLGTASIEKVLPCEVQRRKQRKREGGVNHSVQEGRFSELHEGQQVSHDVGQGPQGPLAKNARLM